MLVYFVIHTVESIVNNGLQKSNKVTLKCPIYYNHLYNYPINRIIKTLMGIILNESIWY